MFDSDIHTRGLSAPAFVRGVKPLVDIEETGMTYRITDDAGFLIAEIRFHNRIHDDLVAVYLQDVCEVLGAAGYHPVTEEEA